MTTRIIIPMPEKIHHLFGEELVAVVTHDNVWDIEGMELGRFRNSIVDMLGDAAVLRGLDDPLDYNPSLSFKYARRVVRAMETEFPGIRFADGNQMGSIDEALERAGIDRIPDMPIIY